MTDNATPLPDVIATDAADPTQSGSSSGSRPCSRLSESPKTSDVFVDTRQGLLSLMEELGACVVHLREGYDATENGNLRGAEIDAGDAMEVLNNIEAQASQLAADLAKWIEWK